jgi:hypothetical protein
MHASNLERGAIEKPLAELETPAAAVHDVPPSYEQLFGRGAANLEQHQQEAAATSEVGTAAIQRINELEEALEAQVRIAALERNLAERRLNGYKQKLEQEAESRRSLETEALEAHKRIAALEKELADKEEDEHKQDEHNHKPGGESEAWKAMEAEVQRLREAEALRMRKSLKDLAPREERFDLGWKLYLRLRERDQDEKFQEDYVAALGDLLPFLPEGWPHGIETVKQTYSEIMNIGAKYSQFLDFMLARLNPFTHKLPIEDGGRLIGLRNTLSFLLNDLERFVKDDLKTTMSLYQDLYGVQHPRWNEVSHLLGLEEPPAAAQR